MANAAIVTANLADAGTWTALTAASLMPASRLKNEHVGKRWRSTAEPDAVYCDLGSQKTFDTLGLFGLTGSSAMTVRAKVSHDNDAYTKVLLRMNGTDASTTFTDTNAGGSAHTWTAAGNAQIDTADSKFGGASGLFDGTGDVVSTPDHADFALGSGNFTVDLWFKTTASSAPGARVLFGQTTFAAAGTSFDILQWTDMSIRARASDGSSLVTLVSTGTYSDVSNPGWHHLAFVRTGNVLKLFIDGVQQGGDTAFTGTVPDSAAALAVSNAGITWQGWVDEVRLSVGIARWTANFTPPQAAADGTASAGDIYDSGVLTVSSAYLDPNYGSFVLPMPASVAGRFVRFDIVDGPASYVEVGIGLVGLREAFTYNFVPGGGVVWTDRSRREKSAGGQTLIFPDNKFRSANVNFDWVPETQREGVWETMARVNGNSVPVLLMLDTASDNICRDAIFGLVVNPIGTNFTGIADIYTATLSVEERK